MDAAGGSPMKKKKSQKGNMLRSSSLGNVKKDKKQGLQSSSVTFQDGDLYRSDSYDGYGSLVGKARQMKNYFGLPIYATQQSPLAIVYQSRGAIIQSESIKSTVDIVHEIDADTSIGLDAMQATTTGNGAAQRKVAQSLLSMAGTESMTNYFLHKGGIEAVARLIFESGDMEVMYVCSAAFYQASRKPENCKVLVEKQALAAIAKLVEYGDQRIRLNAVKIICNLSGLDGVHEEQLIMANVLSVIQSLLTTSTSQDVTCLSIVALNNIMQGLAGNNDIEVAVRTCIHVSKKMDVLHNVPAAIFMMKVFANMSSLLNYTSTMCDESITPLLLHLIDAHPRPEIIGFCAETFLNLSIIRKNRRELGSSGIANYLDRIFTIGDSQARARALTTIGNLLVGSYFFEKIAREDILSTILNSLFDPSQTKQFTAVAYCLSQLALNESCAAILVRCNVVKMNIENLTIAPMEATSYMWNVLVSLSQQPRFFENIIGEREQLFPTLLSEVQKYEDQRIEAIALLAYNLALRPGLEEKLNVEQIEMLVKTLKLVIYRYPPMKQTMLTALIFVANNIRQSRLFILGDDLIKLLNVGGDGGPVMNIKCAALLNLISCEDNCCLALLDAGAQQFLVTVYASLSTAYTNAHKSVTTGARFERTATPGAPLQGEKDPSGKGAQQDTITDSDMEIGQGLIAATLHNLSLKRPTLGAGVLALMLALMKNTKSLRVLHCVRAMANISTQSKAKHILSKEKRLIPILTAIMRCGCEEADRVQHYCAIVVCNVLATKFDKNIMDEIIANGTIVDLVVVTLLRVNSISTKESLGRALFNLMSPLETRMKMATELDVLSATLDLARIESLDLLEICVRSVYNLSCQLPNSPSMAKLAKKFSQLKIPALMIARATSSSAVPGCKPSVAIKFICGMALANMSFVPELAIDLTEEKVSNAAFTVMSLDSDEATYCVSALLFNLSQHRNCVTMADMQAVPLLTSIVTRGPIVCTQLAMAALCNISMYEPFFHQLTNSALPTIVSIMGSPQYENNVRMDARRFVYNLVTRYPACRIPAVLADASSALMSLAKSQTDDAVLISIGRIVKEICSEANDESVHKKLLQDGIMPLLLKLSKLEIPELKLDLACSLFSMTMVHDTIRVLKWDSVDVLFWLTLHDCLGLQDSILRNVGRALRNFTSAPAEAKFIVKEDRFMAVLRALGKSTNEDVLWQAAGICYNILHAEECRKSFLARGAMTFIFELAASNFVSVRHVCSACIHMVPDSMPDMEDPLVLQLILCLLDADGERHAELGERTYVPLPYIMPVLAEKSPFIHSETNFKPTWVTMTCTVDSIFVPAKSEMLTAQSMSYVIRPFDTSSICNSQGYCKFNEHDYHLIMDREAVGSPTEVVDEEDEDSDKGDDMSPTPSSRLDEDSQRLPSATKPKSRKSSKHTLGKMKSKSLDDKKASGRISPAKESYQVTLPKLIDTKKLPDDPVSAIKASGAGGARKSSPAKSKASQSMFTAPKLN